jgi:hypothetical protein
MPDPFEWLTRLSRPARLGLATAGVVAAGTATAKLITRDPEPGPPPTVPVREAEASAAFGGSELEHGATHIELEVDPKTLDWKEEGSVEISGATAIDAENPRVAITVVSPSGHTHRLGPVPVGSDGSFSTVFELNRLDPAAPGTPPSRARLELGRFEVQATSPGGFGSAAAWFTVTRFDEVQNFEWQEPADRLAQRGFDLVANLKTCLANMPVSPAREELERQVAQLETELRNGGPSVGLGAYLAAVMTQLGEFPDEVAQLEDLLEPLEKQLDEWGKEADRMEHQVRHDGQRCSGSAGCDRADLIAQDLDLLTELLTLLRRPIELIGGYRASPELKKALGEQSMPDMETFNRKLADASAMLDARPPLAPGGGSLTMWFSRANSAIERTRAYAQRELFQPYCQQFEGPVLASMQARMWSMQGKDWWKYEISLEGTLTLRYPTTVDGPSVPMTGELTGCATRFRSWDNALRVGWPQLMHGALLFRTAKEPFGGGAACARFDLPVKATLTGDQIVLTLEPAARKDYGEPSTLVRYVVISPLAGGLPAQTSFTLPYKSAHFIWDRALEGKPLKLRVMKQGRQLVVAKDLSASRGGERAKGEYSATVKACNPSCSGGGSPSGSKPQL